MRYLLKRRLKSYFNYDVRTANYLINVSERYGLVYIETPKVGCTAIKKFMQEVEVGAESRPPQNVHDKKNSPLKSPDTSRYSIKHLLDSPKFVRFSFVRDPYTRILSAYLDKIVKNQWERERRLPMLGYDPFEEIEFLDFLKSIRKYPNHRMDIHWMPQYNILRPDRIDYNYVGRFETFNKSLELFVERYISKDTAFTPNKICTHHRTNADNRVREFVGPKEDQLIRQIYQDDFRIFEY